MKLTDKQTVHTKKKIKSQWTNQNALFTYNQGSAYGTPVSGQTFHAEASFCWKKWKWPLTDELKTLSTDQSIVFAADDIIKVFEQWLFCIYASFPVTYCMEIFTFQNTWSLHKTKSLQLLFQK